jgi:hypothetical protein
MTLIELRNMLRINRHRLDDELEIQAEILEKIGRSVVTLNSRQIELKRLLDVAEAKIIARIKENDPKTTNPMAEKEAKDDREYLRAWQAYQAARSEHEEWESLYKAWHARGFDIKALGELFANQYFAINAVRGPYPKNFSQQTPSLDRPRFRASISNDNSSHHEAFDDASTETKDASRPRVRKLVHE